MDVRIAQPLGYSELGGRSNNEDSIFPDPQHTTSQQKWFLVCDGVGGAERGEVASYLAVRSFNEFLQQHPVSVPTDDYIQRAVAYVEDQFNAYFGENPNALGMATTMTMLYVHEAGATVAHIGDSRVYHIRDGRILWCTDDHSYVNELVRAGVLTPDEAHHHPKRNIITRALQGGEKRVHASVQLLNDLRPGDYFFLCSDGVLERVSDELLEGTLRNDADTNEQKMAKLRAYSSSNTRDNFTAYLVQIEQVTGTVAPAYRVTPPVYERFQATTDTEEAITLINMPIPEAVSHNPVPVEPNTLSSFKAPDPPVPTVPTTASPTRQTRAESVRPGDRATLPARTRQAVKPWSVLLFALLGMLVGVGGLMSWQYYNRKTRVASHVPKPATTPTTATNRPSANKAISVATSLSADPVYTAGQTGDAPAATDKPASATAAQAGENYVHESADRHEVSTEANSQPSSVYERVQPVDTKLAVVEDTRTHLKGLRKTGGLWATEPIYTTIGPFKNSVAKVTTRQGAERYLNKEGKEFRSFSDYTDGVATLTEINGKKCYLSRNGNWLDEVKTLSNGKIAVCKNKRWGYLNAQGQIAIRLQYDRAESFDADGTALVTLNGKPFRIDRAGKTTGTRGDSRGVEKKGGEVKKGQYSSKV